MIGRIRTQALESSKYISDWMEHRTGIVTMLEHFLYEPVPKRGAWLYTLGSATLFCITLQFLTGILLLFYYVPTVDHAWDSINYIMNQAYFGTLIRGIHYWFFFFNDAATTEIYTLALHDALRPRRP